MKSETKNNNNRLKVLSLIISILNFYSLIVYGVLNHLLQMNTLFIVCTCSIFAIILLSGVWKFTKKKPTFVISYNRWQDKIFKTEDKYTCITVVGAYKTVFVFIYILLLVFLGLLTTEYVFSVTDVLFLIAVLVIVPLFEGYLDYRQYSSKKPEE